MGTLLLAARMLLAAVFAVAGVAKLLDQPGSRRSLVGFGVPNTAIPAIAVLLPLAELAIAAALVPVDSARWGALAALLLLLCFVAGIANAMRGGGQAPNCHCFGQLHSAPAGWPTLTRNALLAALAAFVVIDGPGPSLTAWVSDRSAAELVAVATSAAAIVLAALLVRVYRERGSVLRDLADAQTKLAGLPAGLPVGTAAPDFALPDLDGEIHTLESLCARGRPVVLLFVSQGCGPCEGMFPEIGNWQRTLGDQLTIAVLTQGDAAGNRPTAEKHGIAMLLQEDNDVLSAYRISGTPSALVVTPDRRIASSAVASQIAIEPLVRLTLRRDPMGPPVRPAEMRN